MTTVSPSVTFCWSPPIPANGFIANRNTLEIYDKYAIGDMLQFACRNGYAISNRSPVQCLSDGRWSKQIPTCLPARISRFLPSFLLFPSFPFLFQLFFLPAWWWRRVSSFINFLNYFLCVCKFCLFVTFTISSSFFFPFPSLADLKNLQ